MLLPAGRSIFISVATTTGAGMQEFVIERKIYYHDTDAGGVVYYANYLKHLEEGRTEFCRHRGIDTAALLARGFSFPVVHVEVDYKSPARYGESIRIETRVEKLGESSIHFSQEIRRNGQLLVKAKTIWACVGRDFKSVKVPPDIAEKLSGI
jgi:acyl-CoA thioester hydrolase